MASKALLPLLIQAAKLRPIFSKSLQLRMASTGKKIISTPDAPAAVGPYSQAVQVGNTLYISGQIGLDPKTGKFVSEDIGEQTTQTLKNMVAILRAAGATSQNVVKTTVLLQDINDYAKVNEIYAGIFSSEPPARAAYQAAALPLGAKVEIESIAIVDSQ